MAGRDRRTPVRVATVTHAPRTRRTWRRLQTTGASSANPSRTGCTGWSGRRSTRRCTSSPSTLTRSQASACARPTRRESRIWRGWTISPYGPPGGAAGSPWRYCTTLPGVHARGFRRAGSGVDGENTTGAVRLYERAGMRVAGGGTNSKRQWMADLRFGRRRSAMRLRSRMCAPRCHGSSTARATSTHRLLPVVRPTRYRHVRRRAGRARTSATRTCAASRAETVRRRRARSPRARGRTSSDLLLAATEAWAGERGGRGAPGCCFAAERGRRAERGARSSRLSPDPALVHDGDRPPRRCRRRPSGRRESRSGPTTRSRTRGPCTSARRRRSPTTGTFAESARRLAVVPVQRSAVRSGALVAREDGCRAGGAPLNSWHFSGDATFGWVGTSAVGDPGGAAGWPRAPPTLVRRLQAAPGARGSASAWTPRIRPGQCGCTSARACAPSGATIRTTADSMSERFEAAASAAGGGGRGRIAGVVRLGR